jgi:WD40 repeat protein
MRLLRIIVLLLVSALVAGVVMVWPVLPMWRAKEDGWSTLQGFSRDSREVITTHYTKDEGVLYVCRRDVLSGNLLAKVILESHKQASYGLTLLDDRQTIATGSGPPSYLMRDTKWNFFDIRSGARVAGPHDSVNQPLETSSSDGQWYCLLRTDPPNGENEFELYSRSKGLVHKWAVSGDLNPVSVKIAPDGQRVAVAWTTLIRRGLGPAEKLSRVSVHDLPSCQEENLIELPPCEHATILGWDGDSLDVLALSWPRKGEDPVNQVYRFRIQGQSVQQDPVNSMLSSFSEGHLNYRVLDLGSDWVAYFALLSPDQQIPIWEKCRDWVIEKLGGAPWPKDAPLCVIKVRDTQTGRFRQTLSPLLINHVRISPDGKYLANRLVDGGIAVWDLDPTPRWMIAVPTGVGTFAVLLLLFGRLRRKRKVAA